MQDSEQTNNQKIRNRKAGRAQESRSEIKSGWVSKAPAEPEHAAPALSWSSRQLVAQGAGAARWDYFFSPM